MPDIETFFRSLRLSMEAHSRGLKHGDIFLPEYLKGQQFTRAFRPVVAALSKQSGLTFDPEWTNHFPKDWNIGTQRVDYVLRNDQGGLPVFFLEVESLDGANLVHFADYKRMSDKYNWNKLWYYYGTVAKGCDDPKTLPRYFVWLLILPERRVSNAFTFWDATPGYGFFHRSLKAVVARNPYRFYDSLIKSLAAAFLERREELPKAGTQDWPKQCLADFQKRCELVFITCTIDRLILSRGVHQFEPRKEVSLQLRWKGH